MFKHKMFKHAVNISNVQTNVQTSNVQTSNVQTNVQTSYVLTICSNISNVVTIGISGIPNATILRSICSNTLIISFKGDHSWPTQTNCSNLPECVQMLANCYPHFGLNSDNLLTSFNLSTARNIINCTNGPHSLCHSQNLFARQREVNIIPVQGQAFPTDKTETETESVRFLCSPSSTYIPVSKKKEEQKLHFRSWLSSFSFVWDSTICIWIQRSPLPLCKGARVSWRRGVPHATPLAANSIWSSPYHPYHGNLIIDYHLWQGGLINQIQMVLNTLWMTCDKDYNGNISEKSSRVLLVRMWSSLSSPSSQTSHEKGFSQRW